MLDAKTLSTALAIALLGCASGTPTPDAPSDATEKPQFPESDMAAPPADGAPDAAPAPDAPAADAKPADAAPALPMGRPEPLPPKDGKPVASRDESVRKGAAACCGEGTCGDCPPLPAGRKEPVPPKDGKPMPASRSVRKGAAACCGEGTCGAC
jgi:DNA polymerase-3 subunit gamma/tau